MLGALRHAHGRRDPAASARPSGIRRLRFPRRPHLSRRRGPRGRSFALLLARADGSHRRLGRRLLRICCADHLAKPRDKHVGVGLLPRFMGERVVGAFEQSVRERVDAAQGGQVVRDDRVRNDAVFLRLDDQCVAAKLGAGIERPVVPRCKGPSPAPAAPMSSIATRAGACALHRFRASPKPGKEPPMADISIHKQPATQITMIGRTAICCKRLTSRPNFARNGCGSTR